MRVSTYVLISVQVAAFFGVVKAFSTSPSSLSLSSSLPKTIAVASTSSSSCLLSAAIDDDETIPTNLPSDVGMDYIPLATMLATGQFEEADQFTRDALITISGAKESGRDFVYFTDVKRIPNTDFATIERLWIKFSKGKFGYTVQKKTMRLCKGDFESFCSKIGWTTKDGDVERKKRWFGASEFTYNLKKATKGHLPLTSALRGTSLVKNLLNHPVWDNDDWMKEPEN
mmetsp:Transcript_56359/g.63026  ORF Transcript_56359/g.63026 Transcript_56359/m.63026 type:complete len:228 (-) Transcript_56359:64-747(-)